MNKFIMLLAGVAITFLHASAQNTVANTDGMQLGLNADKTHYVKWTFSNQIWFRYNESNRGSTVLGEKARETFDIGLRRTRIQMFGQLTDHVFFYTQFGQNSFNFAGQNSGNRKLQAFFHDALGEYLVWKNSDRLKLGGGLTITNGLSRFSQPSASTIMTMDVPVFAQATVDQTDEFSRKLSIYARGQLGKFDYRVVLSDPFPVTTNGQALSSLNSDATFSQRGHHKQYQGFFIWNLVDKEAHTTPYMTGTYLGKKKVFNIEAGFIYQKNAMWSRPATGTDTVYRDMKLWSAALYYDAPIDPEKGTAISAYAGYFNYDFGPGYLRYNGSMNPATGTSLPVFAGSHGNTFPMFGTGNIVYAQVGYLFKKDLLGEDNGTLMPYASFMNAGYDRLNDQMTIWDLGINWLIRSHNSKLSFDYQNRPVFGSNLEKTGHRSQVVLQYQIYI